MGFDWHTALLIMGGIACIEVYRLFKIINEQADEIKDLERQLRRAHHWLSGRIDDLERQISATTAKPYTPSGETWSSWEQYQEKKKRYMRHKLLNCLKEIKVTKNA